MSRWVSPSAANPLQNRSKPMDRTRDILLTKTILYTLKEVFPKLKVPEPQKGFPLLLTVKIDRMLTAKGADDIKEMEFTYDSDKCKFRYAYRIYTKDYSYVHDITVDEFKSLLCLAKLVPININVSLTIGGETIGVKP